MSQRSIEDFKAVLQGGGVHPTKFEVELTFPETVVSDPNLATNEGTFLIKASNLPASNVGLIDVPFRGRKLKVSGDRTFDDWNITVINDVSFGLRKSFEEWSERIQNHNYALGHNQLQDGTGVGGNNGANLGYMGTAMVRQLDRQGQQLKLYQFNGIWPVTIGDIALDFGTNDTVAEYSCTWAVQYWHGAGANADDIKGREIDPNDSDATPVAGSLRKTIS